MSDNQVYRAPPENPQVIYTIQAKPPGPPPPPPLWGRLLIVGCYGVLTLFIGWLF